MLDTIKYTMRVSGESYSTALNSLYSTNITEEWAPGLPDDDWGRTILSYLTPSEIRVASPSRPSVDPWYGVDTKNKEYNYRYLAFNPAAHNDQKGGVKPANYLMGGFYSTTRNQDLVLQIIDYNIHKNEKTDSTTPNMIYDNMPGNSNKDQNLMARESYKKLFSDIGLTMHETSKYEDTFDRPAGAYSKTPTNVPDPTDTQIHELSEDLILLMVCNALGGKREFVPVLAKAAVSVGIAGVFIETHDDPDNAPSDGPNMIPLKDLKELLLKLKDFDSLAKS